MRETDRNETDTAETDIQNSTEENKVANMNVQVGDVVFSATLEENEAVSALVEMMRESPVVIRMNDYSGFEKAGPLGTGLSACNSRITTQAGDIVLYNGNQIVIFYGSNSWSYTRLGHIDDLTGWEDALDNLTISEISEKTSLAKNTVSVVINGMVNKGIVERNINPHNRRQMIVSLTEYAKSLQEKYEMVSQKMNVLFYQGFSEEEQRQFEQYLARILETLIEKLHINK